MKSFPKGWFTWTTYGRYTEIDLNPGSLPKYAPGQPFQFDNQWLFGSAESDTAYTLSNRGIPLGFLIWVTAETGSGNYVSLYDDEASRKKMLAGGVWRKDASWIPVPTDEENYYKLENLAKRGNFLSLSTKKHNDFNNYIQLGADSKEDTKFSFQPARITLQARVYDFEFKETLEDIFKKGVGLNRNLKRQTQFPNLSKSEIVYVVEESFETKDSIKIGVMGTFPMMKKTTITFNEVIGTSGANVSFDGGFEGNQEKSLEVSKSLPLKTEIKIPANKGVDASIYLWSANDVAIAFSAKMEIVGFTDRIVVDHPGEVQEGNVPATVVEEFIKSSGGSTFEIISRSGDALIVKIAGVVKGNIGLKTVMDTVEKTWTLDDLLDFVFGKD